MYYCNSTIVQLEKGADKLKWTLDKKRPICPQICEQICAHIAGGEIEAGARLLSVREVAVEAGVNPNTVQRSFEELERLGVLFSVRGSGWYAAENTNLAKEALQELMKAKTATYFDEMNALGLTVEEIKKYVEEWK